MNNVKFIDQLIELYFDCKALRGTAAADVLLRLIQTKLLSSPQ